MSSSEPARNRGPGPAPDPRADRVERLLRCSADRTLLVRCRPGDGTEELVKIFERGSLADAQREARLGMALDLPGLVRYRSAGLDEASGRPCLVMEYHPGRDLEVLIGEQGPLPPRLAANLVLQLCEILDSLHESAAPDAPHGLLHGDVKPGNVLILERGQPGVLLVDLEHAVARRSAETRDNGVQDGRFTGGTHGFAPPEAYRGARPTRAFDVFAVGATLHFCLTGEPPFTGPEPAAIALTVQQGSRRRKLLAGLPRQLVDLIVACLDAPPGNRPAMGSIAADLRSFMEAGSDDDRTLDTALTQVRSAELDAAAATLAGLRGEPADEIADLLHRRRRLLSRGVELPGRVHGDDLLATAGELATSLRRLSAWLRRFPNHAAALARRLEYRRQATGLVDRVPAQVAVLKREARFGEATALLDAATAAVGLALNLPGPIAAPAEVPARLPGPALRDPLRLLQLAREDVESAAIAHSRFLERLEQAESRLKLDEATQVVEAIAAVYGGASLVVAGLKDRLHRLGFYLEEIGRPRRQLDDLQEQLALHDVDQDLTPLREFLGVCAERAPVSESRAGREKSGLRRLQRGLHDLIREFPHLRTRAGPAAESLDRAMAAMTDLAWQLVEDARTKLEAVPIPVRPLTMILNRLDSLRLLQVMVDRPGHSRTELMDELESIRINVQKARNARDRLARGAEEAMARGHWTTALYDMQRAVGHLELGEAEDTASDRDLMERFEEVKRTKQEIEAAMQRNFELARDYATLLDKPDSSAEERLQVLEHRRNCLRILVDTLKGERAEPYRDDLRDVDIHIVRERADHAELQLDESTDLDQRLRIAADTVAMLERSVEGAEPVGRVQRLINHWQHQHNRMREEADRLEREARRVRARRRLLWTSAALAVAATAIALVLQLF